MYSKPTAGQFINLQIYKSFKDNLHGDSVLYCEFQKLFSIIFFFLVDIVGMFDTTGK